MELYKIYSFVCLTLIPDSCLNHKVSYADVAGSRVLWLMISSDYTSSPAMWGGVLPSILSGNDNLKAQLLFMVFCTIPYLSSHFAMVTDTYNFLVLLKL